MSTLPKPASIFDEVVVSKPDHEVLTVPHFTVGSDEWVGLALRTHGSSTLLIGDRTVSIVRGLVRRAQNHYARLEGGVGIPNQTIEFDACECGYKFSVKLVMKSCDKGGEIANSRSITCSAVRLAHDSERLEVAPLQLAGHGAWDV